MFHRSTRQRSFFPYLGIIAALVLAMLSPLSALAAGPQQITVHAGEFYFKPNTITLTVGQPVQLTIINDGQLDHDMKSAIPIANLSYQKASNPADEQHENAEQGVFDVDFDKGTTAQVTFTPTKAGTYELHCDVAGHTEAGMKGTFVVQAAAAPATAAASTTAQTSVTPQALPKTGEPLGTSSLLWVAGLAGLLSMGGLGVRLGVRSRRGER